MSNVADDDFVDTSYRADSLFDLKRLAPERRSSYIIDAMGIPDSKADNQLSLPPRSSPSWETQICSIPDNHTGVRPLRWVITVQSTTLKTSMSLLFEGG